MGRLSGRSAKYADNEFVINRWIGSSRGLINSPEDQARHGASARRLSLVRARAFRIGLPLELNKLNTIFANIRNYLPPRVDLQFVLIGSVPSPTNWTRRFSDFRIRRRHVYFSPRRESSLHLEISRGTSLNDANDNHDINIADDTRFRNVSTRSRLAIKRHDSGREFVQRTNDKRQYRQLQSRYRNPLPLPSAVRYNEHARSGVWQR